MPAEREQPPIDISYGKLADWLVDRRRIPSDWRKKLALIRSKISSGIDALPKEVDPWFLSLDAECVGYLEAKKIRDILMKALPEERTVFGRLAGVSGEWDAIVRAYEKDSIYLGEAAHIMMQNVNYEIPLQKKQIAKLQQQLTDLERKEAELKRNAAASASRYQQACQDLGISGKNVRSELMASVNTLPEIFTELGDILSGESVGEAVQLYEAFVSYAHSEPEDRSPSVLETLREARSTPFNVEVSIPSVTDTSNGGLEKDNGSHGEDSVAHDEDEDAPGIQWDISLDESTEVPEQNTSTNGGDAAAGIEWDIDLAGESEDPEPEKQEVSGIVWDIDVEEGGKATEEQQETPSESACISPVDAVPQNRLLDMNYRNSLLNDLFEVKAFLGQRAQELENTDSSTLQSQMQAVAPAALQHHSGQTLKAMESNISLALKLLTDSRTRDLLLILTSPRFLDRLEQSLQQKKQSELKSLESLKDLEHKRVELRNALTSSWPKQEELISRTKDVKLNVEKSLSIQYDDRIVNIIGEINTVIF